MKIRELLQADWTVDRLDITVRTSDTRFVTEYHIGPDLRPSRFERWSHETMAGDVYVRDGGNVIYINRTIQFKQSDKPYKGKNRPVGVMLDEIPAELLDLEAACVHPVDCGRGAHGWHGYRIDVVSDLWTGVAGEDEIVEEATE